MKTFTYLEKMSSSLYNRYLTVEANIRASSNSFFESVMALMEAYLKFLLDKENIKYDENYDTFVAMMKKENVKTFLRQYISEKVYDTSIDVAKSINGHKHNNELIINQQIVVNYMNVFYSFSYPYFSKNYDEQKSIEFDEKYFIELYDYSNKELKKIKKQKEELEKSLLRGTNGKLTDENFEKVLEISKMNIESMDRSQAAESLFYAVSTLQNIKQSMIEEKIDAVINELKNQKEQLDSINYSNLYKASNQFIKYDEWLKIYKKYNRVTTELCVFERLKQYPYHYFEVFGQKSYSNYFVNKKIYFFTEKDEIVMRINGFSTQYCRARYEDDKVFEERKNDRFCNVINSIKNMSKLILDDSRFLMFAMDNIKVVKKGKEVRIDLNFIQNNLPTLFKKIVEFVKDDYDYKQKMKNYDETILDYAKGIFNHKYPWKIEDLILNDKKDHDDTQDFIMLIILSNIFSVEEWVYLLEKSKYD